MKAFLIQFGILVGVYFWLYIAISLGAEFGQGVKVFMFLAVAWWTSWLFVKRRQESISRKTSPARSE